MKSKKSLNLPYFNPTLQHPLVTHSWLFIDPKNAYTIFWRNYLRKVLKATQTINVLELLLKRDIKYFKTSSWERNNITVMLIHISGNFNWNFQAVTVKQYFDKGSTLAPPREEIPTTKVYWMKYGRMVRNRIYTIWILVKEGKADFRIRGSDHVIHNLLGNLWL